VLQKAQDWKNNNPTIDTALLAGTHRTGKKEERTRKKEAGEDPQEKAKERSGKI